MLYQSIFLHFVKISIFLLMKHTRFNIYFQGFFEIRRHFSINSSFQICNLHQTISVFDHQFSMEKWLVRSMWHGIMLLCIYIWKKKLLNTYSIELSVYSFKYKRKKTYNLKIQNVNQES